MPLAPLPCVNELTCAAEIWWSQAGSNRRPIACKATALPAELWPRKPQKWSGRRDSNSRPQTWEAYALPTELRPLTDTFRLPSPVPAFRSGGSLLLKPYHARGLSSPGPRLPYAPGVRRSNMERATRFELVTLCLEGRDSTTELHPQKKRL